MMRSRQFLTAMLVGVGVYAYSQPVQGGMIAIPPPGPARIAGADAVIVGKVEALEPVDIKAGLTTYRIAIVRISEGLKGITSEKTLRIGFIPEEKPNPNPKGPFVIRTGARPLQLETGTEGLFILTKQAKEDFYTIRGIVGYYINSNNNKDFAKEVQVAKTAIKVLENPQAALQAKDADTRLLAAAVLIDSYRTYRGPNSKQAPIDAGESKQILEVLADADWKAPSDFRSLRPNPADLFRRVGVTKNDGFTPPTGADYQAATQAWLRANAQTYRIQRFVAGEKK